MPARPLIRRMFNIDLDRYTAIPKDKGLILVTEDFPSLALAASSTCELRLGGQTPKDFRALGIKIGAPDATGEVVPMVGVKVEGFYGPSSSPTDYFIKHGVPAETLHHIIGPGEAQWGVIPFEGIQCVGENHNDSAVFRLTRLVAAAGNQSPVLCMIGYIHDFAD